MHQTVRAGDTLIVWKLDRLGRSLRDLIAMLDDLRERGIAFQSLTEAIDTTTPTDRAMWQMIGPLAELERSVKFGRKPKLTAKRIEHAGKLIEQGESRQYVAEMLGVGRVTLYRALAG